LVEGDIRRLVPRKKHFPDFKYDTDIIRVMTFRDVKSLDRRPLYHLVFNSSTAAQDFANSNYNVFSQPRSLWPAVRFPPASRPEFSCLDVRNAAIRQKAFQKALGLDGDTKAPSDRTSVLLIAYGPGQNGYMSRLPKSQEILTVLEELGVKLCQISKDKTVGLERIVELPHGEVKKLVRPMEGARWIIRCRSESEAQRVVRALHRKPPWEGSSCILRAEVIQ
ncbi:hypothetical protein EDC01DRAFT_619122, partial [Geopyxis carbonaria]